MIVVVQRVYNASVTIDGTINGQIGNGLLVLLGITHNDTQDDLDWLVKKVCNLRIFSDDAGKMNRSLLDVKGELLLVSQFTLHASTKKGNRPSYTEAASPEIAIPLYEQAIQSFSNAMGKPIETGEFGANMQVQLRNDGPVTIIIDSKNRK